jgi:hypothetical protein
MALSFRYLIGDAAEPVLPGSLLWKSPLPMDRHHFQQGGEGGCGQAGFTHGDYFSAARRFCEECQGSIPVPESCQNPTQIDICLMKHGECYHPAKITVSGNGRRRSFVLNVAVSDPGQRIVDTEIAALRRLAGLPGPLFIPRVYHEGRITIDGGRSVKMFLGDWFEGYHEFHISAREPGGIWVWGARDVPVPVSREAAYLLYHQAASILTRYYNPETAEHISHWHHAAGDFVVLCRESKVDVRLITVRQYSPLLKMDKATADPAHKGEQALAALVLFLISLSIRMRLDRLDGIGEMAWADDTAVFGAWSGFLDGLSKSCFPTSLLPDPVAQFENHLADYTPSDFMDLAETIAPALPVGPAEKEVVEKHLSFHVEMLMETICRIGFP